jgi:6-phosphofructokinase
MTRLETSGVVDGGGDAAGLNCVIRGLAHPAISAPSMRATGATFESGA